MTNTRNDVIALIYLYNLGRLKDLDLLCQQTTNFDINLIIGEHNRHEFKTEINNFYTKYKDRIINLSYHGNYGVDIAPFLQQICSKSTLNYKYFIKLHSKNSKLGKFHQVDWGSFLWDSMIGNNLIFDHNVKILQNINIGALCQPFLIYNNKELNNTSKIKIISQSLGINYDMVANGKFMAGSMFMSKVDIFYNILNNQKYIDLLLSNESGKVDDRDHINGTYCHAMERIFGYILKHLNLKIHSTSLYPIIKIYNNKHKQLHLHITYNNLCYLLEDINICGTLKFRDNTKMMIEWYHMPEPVITTYKFLNKNNIVKIDS